ncbi:MAG: RDD family protein [Syntrophaceae bacterium]|nr:RDD family protein [Syntrophaceae bacterium]
MLGQVYGGFWRRLAAFMVDSFIIYFLTTAVFMIGMFALGVSSVFDGIELGGGQMMTAMMRIAMLFNMLYLFMCMVYFTYFIGICGRTPGKMLFGLKVIRDDGEPLNFGVAFLRWIGYLISSLPLNLGFIWIAFDRRKQGFHDKIAGTLVITDKKQESTEGWE